MVRTGPSRQELIQQGNRAGFVGRDAERAAFLRNFDIPIGDGRQRFRFHVHGTAGVGKTFLVQELQHLARERGALTAYVDESAGSVPEALQEICDQFADQGRRLKDLERRLAAYRDRRREAEAAVLAALAPEPAPGPSAGSRAAVEFGIGVVEATVPGGGLLGRALPADQLAQGADRLRAGLSARFRNSDDIELVMSPEKALTPILLRELRAAASAAEWIVLFLDTYERTGPYLDPWLYETLTRATAESGLPATLVVVTAGQRPLDSARWSGLDSVTEVPLAPFTEAEARRLLAAKGVVAEPVVEEVLRLTGGLPVLVSTLANKRPGDPDDVRDPSATAVERFLKSEPAVRRKVARICALPRRLDADVFRVLVVDRPDDELDELYEWLTGTAVRRRARGAGAVPRRRTGADAATGAPQVPARVGRAAPTAGRGVRRVAATTSGAAWRPRTCGRTRSGANCSSRRPTTCSAPARPRRSARRCGRWSRTCREDEVVGRRWARMLQEAGDAADNAVLREWGRALGEALADEESGVAGAMSLLLARPGPDTGGRAAAHTLRGRELRNGREYGRALEEYDRALELDPEQVWAHYGRGFTHQLMDDLPGRAGRLRPGGRTGPRHRVDHLRARGDLSARRPFRGGRRRLRPRLRPRPDRRPKS